MNILFVCTGNINRSPAAETIHLALSPNDSVMSAALKGKPGILTTKRMRYALEKAGYNYTDIRSNSVTKGMIDWADIVFYMQPSHLRDLETGFCKSNKYIKLSKLINKPKINDPHFDKDPKACELVIKDIERAIKIFLQNGKVIIPSWISQPVYPKKSLFL